MYNHFLVGSVLTMNDFQIYSSLRELTASVSQCFNDAASITPHIIPWIRVLLWRADIRSANQEIPHLLWNANINCSVHKSSSSWRPYLMHYNIQLCHGERLSAPAQLTSWRITPCLSSGSVYSIHSQLPTISDTFNYTLLY